MAARLSIVVPVYNSAEFLRKSLASVVSQYFEDWECICVDDGSTDSSADILLEFAETDCRFRIVRQENGGVSSARNKGLDLATGEWVSFFDSDDLLEPCFYSKMFLQIDKHPAADVVVGFIKLLNTDGSLSHLDLEPNSIIVTDDVLAQLFRTANMGVAYRMSDKIVRRRLMTDNNVRFLKGVQTEEDSLCCQAVLARARYAVVDETNQGYIYRRHYGSLSQTVTLAKIKFNVVAVEASIDLWESVRTSGALFFARHAAAGYFFAASRHTSEERLLFYGFLAQNQQVNRRILTFLLLHGSLKMRLFAFILKIAPSYSHGNLIRAIAESRRAR